MIKTQKAESFAWIIIWVFILSIVILGIANLIIYSSSIIDTYRESARLWILKDNLSNIVKKIDTSQIQEKWDLLYI